MNAIYHMKMPKNGIYISTELVSRKEKPNMRIGLSGVRKSIVDG